jgi:hypothetical protein
MVLENCDAIFIIAETGTDEPDRGIRGLPQSNYTISDVVRQFWTRQLVSTSFPIHDNNIKITPC